MRAVHAPTGHIVRFRLVAEILSFDLVDLRPQLRAQRVLNKARVPQRSRVT